MGYYLRLFSPTDELPRFEDLKEAVEADAPYTLKLETGDEADWTQLVLAHADGTPVAMVERNPVVPGELGADELREFLDERVADAQPASAADWLRAYLPTVRCIYAFQVLSGADRDDGWSALAELRLAISETAGGIWHAEDEGFTNEHGHQITWEFAEDVQGPRTMAVLRDGEWVGFEMDLGNSAHREAFTRGEVPRGAKL